METLLAEQTTAADKMMWMSCIAVLRFERCSHYLDC